MRVQVAKVTDEGRDEILDALDTLSNIDTYMLPWSMFEAWVAEAERHADEDGACYIEISQHDSLSGRTEFVDIENWKWEEIHV